MNAVIRHWRFGDSRVKYWLFAGGPGNEMQMLVAEQKMGCIRYRPLPEVIQQPQKLERDTSVGLIEALISYIWAG